MFNKTWKYFIKNIILFAIVSHKQKLSFSKLWFYFWLVNLTQGKYPTRGESEGGGGKQAEQKTNKLSFIIKLEVINGSCKDLKPSVNSPNTDK